MSSSAVGDADEAVLAEKFAVMRPFLDERGWRIYLGGKDNFEADRSWSWARAGGATVR